MMSPLQSAPPAQPKILATNNMLDQQTLEPTNLVFITRIRLRILILLV